MTKEVLNKMPEKVRKTIEYLKESYHNADAKTVQRSLSLAYLTGLLDAGLITENEKRILFIYTTI